MNHLRAPLMGLTIGLCYWLLFALLRTGVEAFIVASPGLWLAFDRFTAILEMVAPFTLPCMGLALLGMCLGTYLRCRELRSELEVASPGA